VTSESLADVQDRREPAGGQPSGRPLGGLERREEDELMQALADSYTFWILLLAVLIVVYLLPTLIGMIRGVDRLALLFLVNLIGAPTGIGWLAAMILAFGPRRLPPVSPRPHYEAAQRRGRTWMPGQWDGR
jgi:hypothetical protein